MYAVDSSNMEQIIDAVEFISNNVTDPKAAAVLAFDYQNNTVNILPVCGILSDS